MNSEEKWSKCENFFDSLICLLWQTHTVVGSCNVDKSRYLVPDGTKDLITYQSKPSNSFRISDHWNWFANTKKCPNESYIQCYSVDLPEPNKRLKPKKASKPIEAVQVAITDLNGIYHCVYGEKWNILTGEFEWVESDPVEIAAMTMR